MSHEIHDEMFLQVDGRGLAWHSIQKATTTAATLPSEGLRILGADVLVEKGPVAVYSERLGEWILDPTHAGIIRPPLGSSTVDRVLGIVSNEYEVVQHSDLAAALDSLVEAGWVMETMGILHEGAQMFAAFAAEGWVVNRRDIRMFWGASVRHAQSALNIACTPICYVCANTYQAGQSAATEKISIPHYRTARQELDWAMDVLVRAHAREEELVEQLTAFGHTPMTDEALEAFFTKVYAFPKPGRRMQIIQQRLAAAGGSWDSLEEDTIQEYTRMYEANEAGRAQILKLRESCLGLADKYASDQPDFAGTAWIAWQSLTEAESHRKGNDIGHSVLFGERKERMERGYRELLTLAASAN